MISTLFLSLAALTLVSITFAQQPVTLISSTLPACAQSCAILLQAQQACVPPPNGAAAVSSQGTYTLCFCQSTYLTPLSGPNAQSVCSACPAADTTALTSWFTGFCQKGGPVQAPTTTAAKPTTAKVAPTAKSTGAKGAGGVTQDTSPEAQNHSWISLHTRWVVMIIVLFFGLIGFAFLIWWLRRRHHRKRDLGDHSRAPGVQPDMNTWGPSQSAHDFHAPGEAAVAVPQTPPPAMTEKGKERETRPSSAIGSKRNSRRLKKGLGAQEV